MADRTLARVLGVLAIALPFWPAPVWAGLQCARRADILSYLAEKYSEGPVALGVTNNGGLVEVLTAKDGETWTIIVTTPMGLSCMVAAGEGWRAVTPEPEEPEA